MNFKYFIFGLLNLIFGVTGFIYTTKAKMKGEKDEYGNFIKLFAGTIGFIFLGLWMIIEQLIKLFS